MRTTAKTGTTPADELDEAARAQIRERLAWTPAQRLRHLRALVAFEERAHRARRVR